MTPALPYATITEAASAIRARQISPLELTRICLERIAAINPTLNAFITLTAESALSDAQTATEAVMRGDKLGPLHGIPLALKDLFDVRGVVTTAGSPLMKDNLAHRDAFVVTRLREAGAILLGKLNLHEWALGVTNINPHFGPARNPHNAAYITGGSSGGSGAALAAGLCLGSLGSDTGGSIRIPASLCGVVGLKPTYGRVSTRGVVPLARTLDHVGPMGRCVDDVALLWQVISGYDRDDAYSDADAQFIIPNSDFRKHPSEIRIGVPDESFFADLHPETEAAIRAAIDVMKNLGFGLHAVTLPGFAVSEQASGKILLADAAAYHQEHIERHADQIGEDVLTRLKWGLEVTGVEYANARHTQIEWRRKMDVLFEAIDALVLPATPFPATPIEGSDPLQLSQGNLTRFTRMFNLTGNPALGLPCGLTSAQLPIGLQFVGPRGHEAKLLHVARMLEISDRRFRIPEITSTKA
jgi:aspartyl-tRNA(Asn)/glutamyl-tRNA(Gln) amidotransferase subunit A